MALAHALMTRARRLARFGSSASNDFCSFSKSCCSMRCRYCLSCCTASDVMDGLRWYLGGGGGGGCASDELKAADAAAAGAGSQRGEIGMPATAGKVVVATVEGAIWTLGLSGEYVVAGDVWWSRASRLARFDSNVDAGTSAGCAATIDGR
ncbi:hypothetical protein H310_12548 [Aphanomyces invadans]|uniref:Uncharacterized protein n=1 Tax=Aphanomyces invadans TaxID=157072 RepID=A0A024TIT3_9STRA|nr:hypothetical protein H310_12548 [Aphanomyces invadans]ETV93506.1 hypothetical protein H310_12548 [Aphanomyces invadans]|eukprot:XP_008877848.1 hypothetical protein H310_12548 [Aphanomyces invadans]